MHISKFLGKCLRYLTNSDYRFAVNASKFDMYHDMADEEYLQRVFRGRMGYDLNLNNPQTFNQKLQWLKLHDHRPEYTTMVDKYEMKAYVAKRIGESYVIPTIGIWNHFNEIDFNKLPNQFVLKCTHDSGGLVICHDKGKFDIKKAKKKIEHSLKRNYYYLGREWPYKDVKPRILAEKLLHNGSLFYDLNIAEKNNLLNDLLVEYKLFCFNGEPKIFLVSMGSPHGEGRTNDIYDIDFHHMPVSVTHPNALFELPKPKEYNELIWIAKELAKGIPHVRVDMYVVDGKIYIGELTFYHAAGFCDFKPKEWDRLFGAWLKLPEKY